MNMRGERRRDDRRRAERRALPRPTSDEAWLSAWGAAGQTQSGIDSGNGPGLGADPLKPGDSSFMAREAQRMVAGDGAALPRILRTYVAARAALGLALALAPWLGVLMGGRLPLPLLALCLLYAGQAVSLWLLHEPRPGQQPLDHLLPRQWAWTIGVDLFVFSALRLLDLHGQLNYAALLVLPVLMSGVLTQRRVALATAAAVALLLLVGVALEDPDRGDVLARLSLAGLGGAGMFLVTLLASELALRLAAEEQTARSSLEMARQQTLLNRLVIEEMADGVLVVDRQGRVRAINPAARGLLGQGGRTLQVQALLGDQAGLQPLVQALQSAYLQGGWPALARELRIEVGGGETRSLQVRARFTRRGGIGANDATPPEDICVLFLEDSRAVQARARQDKLAAMGRMSAGIAHELRNPLAAIAQANALMLEDALVPAQHQLAHIVADNVRRLKRIIDDVMAVAPGTATAGESLDAVAEVQQVCDDWLGAAPDEMAARDRLLIELPLGPLPVRFDADHLRRVLVNLLDNAARHATGAAGALKLRLAGGVLPGTLHLTVASDGPAIMPDVERHLFEPFFSTRSRGSGLGLYICRELCERHGASIEFGLAPPGARHRNVFWVSLRSVAPG